MSRQAKVVTLRSNIILENEDAALRMLLPMLKEVLYPGRDVLPEREVVIVIEVLPL